jgi:hypothetical protein
MRVCYIDASLRSNIGHYANSCRHIVGEFRRRNADVDVYGNRALEPGLAEELGAIPLFRHGTYDTIVAYFLVSVLQPVDYRMARSSFLCDLRAVWRRGPYDLVFVNSVMPAELAAVGLWLNSFPAAAVPRVAMEFGAPTGDGIHDPYLGGWWQQFPRFYRQAAVILGRRRSDSLFLFTFDAAASAEYAKLLGRPVETMPAVHVGRQEPRRRVRRSDNRVTIAFLGHQRLEKGYHLIPAIIRQLRARAVPVTVLVHNGDPDEVTVDRELRSMAADAPHLVFEHRTADARYWQDLMDRSDLIVLPYDPTRYRASYSAVAVEAAGEGIPMVVPAATTMETLVNTVQGGGTVFAGWEASAVSDAIEKAVADFESLASRAMAGAVEWRRANGAARFADRLLVAMPGGGESIALPHGHDVAMNVAMGFILDAVFAGAIAGVKGLMRIERICRSH